MDLDRIECCKITIQFRDTTGIRKQHVIEAAGPCMPDVDPAPVAFQWSRLSCVAVRVERSTKAEIIIAERGDDRAPAFNAFRDDLSTELAFNPGTIEFDNNTRVNPQASVEPRSQPCRGDIEISARRLPVVEQRRRRPVDFTNKFVRTIPLIL